MEHCSQCLYKIWQLMHYTKYVMHYTKYGNSCPLQNMATRSLYKIWQLVPYTKYGNSCSIQNMATRAKMPHHG